MQHHLFGALTYVRALDTGGSGFTIVYVRVEVGCMRIPPLIVFALAGAVLVSCNGSRLPDPVSPSPAPAGVSRERPLPRILWGIWTVNVSADHTVFDVVPDRLNALHFNVVRLLEQTVCTDCLSIGNAHLLANGDLTVDVTLKHPFPSLIQFTAFDVRGILIGNSDYTFPLSGRIVAWGDDQLRFLNADGYTALFNPEEFPEDSPGPPALKYIPGKWKVGSDFSATLNPYLAYCEDQPRRIFTAGSVQTRTAVLHLPSGPLKFGYAVEACWVPVENVVDPLTDFPPEANCNEAYKVKVDVGSGLLPEAGSSVQVQVEVWDHQGKGTISSVTIESPELFDGETALTFSTATGEESYLFEAVLSNELGAYIGQYPLLVRIADTQADPNLGFIDSWQVGEVKVGPKAGWARTWGNENHNWVYGMAATQEGDVYVIGFLYGTIDFDPGPEVEERTDDDGGWYLSKFDQHGVFIWVATWDLLPSDVVDVAVDLEGNVYVASTFVGPYDFDPGPGVYELTSVFAYDPFLCKLDGNGNFQWALRWGDEIEGPFGGPVATDSLGYVYIAGTFSTYYEVDFDPGPSEDNHKGSGGADFFLSKFDSSGNYQWGRTWRGGDAAVPWSIACGPGQSLYVGGRFEGGADFDPGPGEDLRNRSEDGNLFLSKFTTGGAYQWVRAWGSHEYMGSYTDVYGVATDSSGDILVTGDFNTKVDFDPGDEVVERYPVGNADAFLSKFSPEGDFQWVQTWGGSSIGNSVAVDNQDNILVTGPFWLTVDFDPGPGIQKHTALGYYDPYLLKFHPSGEFDWVCVWGGIIYEEGKEIALDKDGNAYVAGEYSGSVDFDPGPAVDIQTSFGLFDASLSKFPPDGNW